MNAQDVYRLTHSARCMCDEIESAAELGQPTTVREHADELGVIAQAIREVAEGVSA